MPLDFQAALDQYGYVGVLAQQNPELAPLLKQAVDQEWNSARFERELANTPWYKRLSERRRAIALQRSTDPATWTQTLANKKTEVQALAARMGMRIDVNHWATRALENEWDEGALRAILTADKRNTFVQTNGAYTGEAGEIEAHVRETYAAYGIPASADRVKQVAANVIGGRTTLGGIDNETRALAKKQYSQFAAEIDSGMTIRDIADPYVQTMANTLEMAGTDIGLDDRYIKQALQARNAQGQPTMLPLHEFERTLKNDARWQYTKQAKDETYAVLQQVGQDWGLA